MSVFKKSRSPELEAALIAEAEEFREVSNELGLAFRGAQQEAYRAWCQHEAELEKKGKSMKKKNK